MLPNIMMVQPPSTASGRVANTAPKNGNIPARIIMQAPTPMTIRFTTFVMAISPTFWLKEVTGRHPRIPDSMLAYPSQAIEPSVSFTVTGRFNPEIASAEVSPMVSVAETRKINVMDTIAPALNTGLNGMMDGRLTAAVSCSAEKSTAPINTARI